MQSSNISQNPSGEIRVAEDAPQAGGQIPPQKSKIALPPAVTNLIDRARVAFGNIKNRIGITKNPKFTTIAIIVAILLLVTLFLFVVAVVVRTLSPSGDNSKYVGFGNEPKPTPVVEKSSLEAKIEELRSEVQVFELQENKLLPPQVDWKPEF